jgi:hypothetical protein
MNRFLVPLGVFALLVVVLVIGIRHSPDKGIIVSPLLGRAAPAFALPSLLEPGHLVRGVPRRARHAPQGEGQRCRAPDRP